MNDKIYSYTKKSYLALDNLVKLVLVPNPMHQLKNVKGDAHPFFGFLAYLGVLALLCTLRPLASMLCEAWVGVFCKWVHKIVQKRRLMLEGFIDRGVSYCEEQNSIFLIK